MAVQPLELRDPEGEVVGACLSCTVTGHVFGPILGADHDLDALDYADAFLRWWQYSGHGDPRMANVDFLKSERASFDRFVASALDGGFAVTMLPILDDQDFARLYAQIHPETRDDYAADYPEGL